METAVWGRTPSSAPRILIADDQPSIVEALRFLLKTNGYQTVGVSSPEGVLAAFESESFDVLLMDLNYTRDTTSGAEGLDLLSRIQMLDRTIPVVVMTAWGNMELVVKAMQRGASDFITKPWENARVLSSISAQLERRQRLNQRERDEFCELEEAREVQRGLLLRMTPQITGCQISAAWRPARFVGGDYFDVLKFNKNLVGLCIADVAGKGMPAALLMSNLQAAVKAFASEHISPAELCAKVNGVVRENLSEGRFITFFYGVLDAVRHRFLYSNAGHNPPILIRADGSCARLDKGGMVLGKFPDCAYSENTVTLAGGDRLVFFTDGISEAEDGSGTEFGEDRLVDAAVKNRSMTPAELQEKIISLVSKHCAGHFGDDATLIVVGIE